MVLNRWHPHPLLRTQCGGHQPAESNSKACGAAPTFVMEKKNLLFFSICAQGYTPFSKYLLLQPGKSWAGQPEPPVLPQDIGHFYPKMMVEGKRAALPHNHLIYCSKRTNIE